MQSVDSVEIFLLHIPIVIKTNVINIFVLFNNTQLNKS